jgi:hypothetical protein
MLKTAKFWLILFKRDAQNSLSLLFSINFGKKNFFKFLL